MKLTEASLDRQIAAKRNTLSLGDLLLSTGAAEGPFRNPQPFTRGFWTHVKRALAAYRLERSTPCLTKF